MRSVVPIALAGAALFLAGCGEASTSTDEAPPPAPAASAVGSTVKPSAQPRRPKLLVLSSGGTNTTTERTVLRGRVVISSGSLDGVHVTVDGAPATVSGTHWSKVVMVDHGTRRFLVTASKPGADSGSFVIKKTRKPSAAEPAH